MNIKKQEDSQGSQNKITQNRIALFSFFISCVLLFTIPTLHIIASSPSEFQNPGAVTGTMLFISSIAFLFLWFITYKTTGVAKNILTFFSLIVCLSFLTNFFLLEGNYGIMDFFIFHKPKMLETTVSQGILDLCIFITILFVGYFLLKKLAATILLILLGFVSFVLALSAVTSLTVIAQYTDAPTEPEYNHINSDSINPKFHFSASGKNVLILFFDRFLGGFVPDILKDVPELKQELAGFTWYPNTLSPGTGTPVGLPAIYGGYAYTDIESMQENDYDWPNGWRTPKDAQMQDRFISSTSFMVNKFVGEGYRSFINDPLFLKPEKISMLSNNSYSEKLIGKYNNLFFEKEVASLKEDTGNPISLIAEYLLPFSLFKVSPPSLRKHLYNNGRWWNMSDLGSDRHWTSKYIDNLSLALAWPLISTVDTQLKGSYMFSVNSMTHDSYAALDNGEFQTVVPPNKEFDQAWKRLFHSSAIPNKDVLRFKSNFTAVHFYSAKEALVRTAAWLKWMRENNVYDNTKIVIVSDHGQTWLHDPMFETRSNDNHIWYPGYHAVLMTKDFNDTGDLEINDTFMTIADVAAFALDAIESNAQEKYGFNKKDNGFRLYTNEGTLIVKDNIFNLSNWEYTP